MILPEGTIRTTKNGYQIIKQNGKWVYIKKEKNPNPIKEKLKPNYPPIKLPKNIKETKYTGYYISTEGVAYRAPGKFDIKRTINEYGLINLKTTLRGNPKHKKYQYPCINVSIKDENGKFLKQKRVNIHNLVAETFIPNPNNLPEIDHIDRDKHNNHVSNLRWVDRYENMRWQAVIFEVKDTLSGEIYTGENVANWVRENWDWISLRTKMSQKQFIKSFNYKRKYAKLILTKLN